MNLYPQGAYYFGTDEDYSFHMGLMERMQASQEQYNPDDYIETASLGTEITPQLLRKLRSVAAQYGLSRSSIEYMRPAFSLNPIE